MSPSQPEITFIFPEEAKEDSHPNFRPSTPPPIAHELVPLSTTTSQSPFPSHKFTLHLIDTKTRRVCSLPDYVDTLSSRLQLMLYQRLFSSAISVDPLNQFDFGALWKRLKLNPARPFTDRFMNQARKVLGNDEHNIGFNCLDSLTRLWRERVLDLDVPGVDETLQLIYRTQPKAEKKGKGKGKGKAKAIDPLISQEELDLARAIEESLKGMSGDLVRTGDHQFALSVAESMKQFQFDAAVPSDEGSQDLGLFTGGAAEGSGLPDELANDSDLLWVLQESILAQAKHAYGQGVHWCH
jgi:exonuclease V